MRESSSKSDATDIARIDDQIQPLLLWLQIESGAGLERSPRDQDELC